MDEHAARVDTTVVQHARAARLLQADAEVEAGRVLVEQPVVVREDKGALRGSQWVKSGLPPRYRPLPTRQ
jgi:hypothetical protein